jgi:hypothetical protein
MSLIDTLRSAIASSSRPASRLIDEVRLDTALPPPAIDHAFDAIDTFVDAAHLVRGRRPSDSPPTPLRQDSGSHPTPARCESGSQRMPRRQRPGGKQAGKRAERKKAAEAGLSRDALIVGVHAPAPAARQHAVALLDYLFAIGCRPGDEILAMSLPGVGLYSMQGVYRHLCAERGWQEIHWDGATGVGCQLGKLCRRRYRDVPSSYREWPDQRRYETMYTKNRVYVLPDPATVPGLADGMTAAPSSSTVTAFPRAKAARRAA